MFRRHDNVKSITSRWRVLSTLLAVALTLAACGENVGSAASSDLASAASESPVLSAGPPPPTGEGQPGGPAVDLFVRYVAAINARDLEAYARLFAEDAVFVDAGRRLSGISEIRSFGADLIRVESRYVIVQLSGQGNEARIVFDYTAPGVGYSLNDGQGELIANEDGLIRSLRLD